MNIPLSENILLMGISILGFIIWVILGAYWSVCREFFHTKYSFFDFSFIVLYFVEQLILIVLSYRYPAYMAFWLSSFALIVVTTVSLQKLLMDSKDRQASYLSGRYYHLSLALEKRLMESEQEKEALRNKNEEMIRAIARLEQKG